MGKEKMWIVQAGSVLGQECVHPMHAGVAPRPAPCAPMHPSLLPPPPAPSPKLPATCSVPVGPMPSGELFLVHKVNKEASSLLLFSTPRASPGHAGPVLSCGRFLVHSSLTLAPSL
jgi:hypothetical protein